MLLDFIQKMDNQRDWKKHTTPNSKYKYLGKFSKSKQGSRTNGETKKAYFGEKSSGLSQFYGDTTHAVLCPSDHWNETAQTRTQRQDLLLEKLYEHYEVNAVPMWSLEMSICPVVMSVSGVELRGNCMLIWKWSFNSKNKHVAFNQAWN